MTRPILSPQSLRHIMVATIVIGFTTLCVVGVTLTTRAQGPPPAPKAVPKTQDSAKTRVAWKRDGIGRIEVTGSRMGKHLKDATEALQAVADRLDCLRTHKPHVRWSRLTWIDGRIQGLAVADSGVYGNVALLALRDLLPGRSTAGSGVQQIRGRTERSSFRVRILIGAPRP